MTAQPFSLAECPRHLDRGEVTQRQSRSLTLDTPVLENSSRHGQTMTRTKQQNIFWIQIREAVPPSHIFPDQTAVSHQYLELPKENTQSEYHERPLTNPKLQRRDPSVHWGKDQHVSGKYAHTSPLLLTVGNTREMVTEPTLLGSVTL